MRSPALLLPGRTGRTRRRGPPFVPLEELSRHAGDFPLELLAALTRFLRVGARSRHDLLTEAGQALLVAEQGEPVAVGELVAAELTEKLVGPLKVLLAGPGVVL